MSALQLNFNLICLNDTFIKFIYRYIMYVKVSFSCIQCTHVHAYNIRSVLLLYETMRVQVLSNKDKLNIYTVYVI